MRVQEVWIRFYKSFNFDYELKASPNAKPKKWQELDGRWMPHIRIPVESDITAVVGANESGKTHLLDAIKIALTGEGLLQRDFCRSSSLFSVEQGSRRYPEVGLTLNLNDEDSTAISEAEIPVLKNGAVLILRSAPTVAEVVNDKEERVQLNEEQSKVLQERMPHPHELLTDVALPDFVSISALAHDEAKVKSRKERSRLLGILSTVTSAADVTSQAESLVSEAVDDHEIEGQKLGVDLLVHVAHIEETSFKELQKAIVEEREGLVNGLIPVSYTHLTLPTTPYV